MANIDCISGSLESDETTSVGEDGWILEYAMTLVQPQPVMLLQVGNKQTGKLLAHMPKLHLNNVIKGAFPSTNGWMRSTDPTVPQAAAMTSLMMSSSQIHYQEG